MARVKMKPSNGPSLGYKVPPDTRRQKRKMQVSPTNSMKKIESMKYGQVSVPNLNPLDRNSQMDSQASLKKGSARGFSPNNYDNAMSSRSGHYSPNVQRSLSPNTKLKKSNVSQSETERLFERNHKLASQINIVEELNG